MIYKRHDFKYVKREETPILLAEFLSFSFALTLSLREIFSETNYSAYCWKA